MIRYRFSELLAERRFQTGKRVTAADVSEATGIHRGTLSKMATQRANVTVEVLDKLCRYFGVSIGEVVEYVPDDRKAGKRSR